MPTWTGLLDGEDPIFTYYRNFEQDTNRDGALQTLRSEDLPADSVQLHDAVTQQCEIIIFGSTLLADSPAAHDGRYISVTLVSHEDESDYTRASVASAAVALYEADDVGRC